MQALIYDEVTQEAATLLVSIQQLFEKEVEQHFSAAACRVREVIPTVL